jgi:uncharacterized protein (DUF2225 family)
MSDNFCNRTSTEDCSIVVVFDKIFPQFTSLKVCFKYMCDYVAIQITHRIIVQPTQAQRYHISSLLKTCVPKSQIALDVDCCLRDLYEVSFDRIVIENLFNYE